MAQIPTDCLLLSQFLNAAQARWRNPAEQPAWYSNFSRSCCEQPGGDRRLQARYTVPIGSESAIQCVRPNGFISGSGGFINGVPVEKFTEPRIISLQLTGEDMDLTGDLSRVGVPIQGMTELINLDISNFKGLTGPLPTFPVALINLNYLILANNSLSGPIRAYPTVNLPPRIENLNLENNNFSGEVQIVLPNLTYGPQVISKPIFQCMLRGTTGNDGMCLGPHVPDTCYSINQGSTTTPLRNCTAAELQPFNPPPDIITTTTSRTTTTRSTTSRTTTTRTTLSTISTSTTTSVSSTPPPGSVTVSSTSSGTSTGVIVASVLIPVLIFGSIIITWLCCRRRRRAAAQMVDAYPKPVDPVVVTVQQTYYPAASVYPAQGYGVQPGYAAAQPGFVDTAAAQAVPAAQPVAPYSDPYDAPPAYTDAMADPAVSDVDALVAALPNEGSSSAPAGGSSAPVAGTASADEVKPKE
ncbi:hypothetical protein DFJ74DRAFT_688258 [Hyaloraphidium curvatum]|nr:hypothetical protein DFJ74DRAFT_688258 [Hyaloraphidium curvatum]